MKDSTSNDDKVVKQVMVFQYLNTLGTPEEIALIASCSNLT